MGRLTSEREFISIQGLRALAAAMVVLFHLAAFEHRFLPGEAVAPKLFSLGETGVDLFFIISGFIITTTTRGQFGDRRNAAWFFFRRVTRIYPVYWVYCSVLLVAWLVHPGIFSGLRGQPDILASFLLLPTHGALLLLVSWSLTYEMQFYVLFAVALVLLPERRLLTVVGVWAAMIVARNLFVADSFGRIDIMFSLYNLEFLAGCVLAIFAGRVSRRAGLVSLFVGVAALVVGCALFSEPDGRLQDGWPRILFAGGGFALVCLAAVVWERPIRQAAPRLLVALGDSSYSLYLSHLLTCTLVGLAWKALWPSAGLSVHVLALTSAFVAALAGGWLSFRWLERPLLDVSRRLARRVVDGAPRAVDVGASRPVEEPGPMDVSADRVPGWARGGS